MSLHKSLAVDQLSGQPLDPSNAIRAKDGRFYNASTLGKAGEDPLLSLVTGHPVEPAVAGGEDADAAMLVQDLEDLVAPPADARKPHTVHDFVLRHAQELMINEVLPSTEPTRLVFIGNQLDGVSTCIERLLHAHFLPQDTRVPIVINLVPGAVSAPRITQRRRTGAREEIPLALPVYDGRHTPAAARDGVTSDHVPWAALKTALTQRAKLLLETVNADPGATPRFIHTDAEIVVRLSSPAYPHLTLVDVPGRAVHPPSYLAAVEDVMHAYLKQDHVFPVVVARATSTLNNVAAISLLQQHHSHLLPRSSIVFTRVDMDRRADDTLTALLRSDLLEYFGFGFAVLASPRTAPARHDGSDADGDGDDDASAAAARCDHRVYAQAGEEEERIAAELAHIEALEGKVGIGSLLAIVKRKCEDTLLHTWVAHAYHAAHARRQHLHAQLLELSPYFTTTMPASSKDWRARAMEAEPCKRDLPLPETTPELLLRTYVVERAEEILNACKHSMHACVLRRINELATELERAEASIERELAQHEEEERESAANSGGDGDDDGSAGDAQAIVEKMQMARRCHKKIASRVDDIAAKLRAGANADALATIVSRALEADNSDVKMHRFAALIANTRSDLRSLLLERVDAVLADAAVEFADTYTRDARKLFTFTGSKFVAFEHATPSPASAYTSTSVRYDPPTSESLAQKLRFHLVAAMMDVDFDDIHATLFADLNRPLDLTEKDGVEDTRLALLLDMERVDRGLVDINTLHALLQTNKQEEYFANTVLDDISPEFFEGVGESTLQQLRFFFQQDPSFTSITLTLGDEIPAETVINALGVLCVSKHLTELTVHSLDFTRKDDAGDLFAKEALKELLLYSRTLRTLTLVSCQCGGTGWLDAALRHNVSVTTLQTRHEDEPEFLVTKREDFQDTQAVVY
ncbi:hypothetical protein PTSG_04903 [Salpingoeca rosetta]|uniref:Dynamin N-terminal domain-containing protein n=1 Tax=Salpingoeca rosetta (strain ATCC 50818 / BSB-021) TaxID=946362 RepID=F2U8Y6_SALR5|nr:uncharacterized protein PTSG_04903 [Salpingoeca rosetta]EGD73189.1 hypothetical protein PTSG_04903 [Salpingoeca rosetta]|eukprot:XP_004994220.1 hypothetical protein PTSG_04903 [Salpingoeca rosetta]